jgi:hypothetical protein
MYIKGGLLGIGTSGRWKGGREGGNMLIVHCMHI